MRPRLIAFLVCMAMAGGLILAAPVIATGVPVISFFKTTTQTSVPGTATSSHPIHWDDTSGRMRFSDGTSDRYVPACSPTASGQVCQWNGSTWTAAVAGGGGVDGGVSATVRQVELSPVDYAYSTYVNSGALGGANQPNTGGGGPNTNAAQFIVMKDMTMTGVRFYWRPNTSRTIACSLWSFGTPGTRLQQKNIATTGEGIYEATFDTPQTLIAGHSYVVSFYDLGGFDYSYFTSPLAYAPPQLGGPYLVWQSWSLFSGSDSYPSNSAASERYPVEPILAVP